MEESEAKSGNYRSRNVMEIITSHGRQMATAGLYEQAAAVIPLLWSSHNLLFETRPHGVTVSLLLHYGHTNTLVLGTHILHDD